MIGLPSPLKLIINSLEIESRPAIDWLCDLGEETYIIGDLDSLIWKNGNNATCLIGGKKDLVYKVPK